MRDELLKHALDTAAFGHRVWPARAGALTRIRREVRRWLAPLEVMPEVEADLVLAVNEAAANVIDHAYRTGDDTGVHGDGRASSRCSSGPSREPFCSRLSTTGSGGRPARTPPAGGAESRSCTAWSRPC